MEEAAILNSMEAHPYEEVAYDIYPFDNALQKQVPDWWVNWQSRWM